jgi:hypothetical protein
MNLVVTLLIWAAVLASALTIGVLLLWWRGVDMIALPGLGLILATPVLVLLLLLAEIALVILAILGRAVRASV